MLLLGCVGCASTPKKEEKTTKTAKENIPEPNVGGPGEIVRKYDINEDKRADLWKIYVKKADARVKDNMVLIRVEIDLNSDGRIDVQRFYKGGNKVRERFDLDYDGRFDVVNIYQQSYLIKQEYFLRSKSRPDVFKYFELIGKRQKKKVRLIRKERDTNLDGKIDYWEYWENGNLDRIGRDTDFDGKVDVWEKGDSN